MGVVLVTGASRGIGAAIARAFAGEGMDVAVNYHKNTDKAVALCAELSGMGVRALPVQADVSDSAQVTAMFDAVRRELGDPEILVNNAGISMFGLLTELSDSDWQKMLSTNLSSVFYCCKAALPVMIRAHKGVIVNIASMWGEVGASCEAAYSAAKAGVIGLTKALAKEVGPSGVRVNAVSPGVVMTDMMAGFSEQEVAALTEEAPLMMTGTPEDIASAVLYLASDRARFVTGQVLPVNGGMVI